MKNDTQFDVRDLHEVLSRFQAAFAGMDPLAVWRTYEWFELDQQVLIELLELAGDEWKPILEERARSQGT